MEVEIQSEWLIQGSARNLFYFLFQVARQLQPSVVYIGDAERTFVKKVPKTDKVTGHVKEKPISSAES